MTILARLTGFFVLGTLVLVGGCSDDRTGIGSASAVPGVVAGANAKLVVDFYTQAFIRKDVAGASHSYVAENYMQHNPQVADGRKAFIEAMGSYVATSGVTFRIGRVIDGGDIIVVHAESTEGSGQRSAIADIFRVENQKIIEHWDVIQNIPATTASGRPMVS